MKVVIDRFENELAICEKSDRNMVKIPRSKLPSNVKEGDVLIIEGDRILVDELETAQKRKQAESLLRDLWK